ncbi:uncharacterized protein [Miscanthus floridulus]|uniref:uncharacterized protein n=1 Tax=Miscanthus floridulus TaxID=154761 RepID=UPI00345765CF
MSRNLHSGCAGGSGDDDLPPPPPPTPSDLLAMLVEDTKPPVFKEAEELLQAEEWLNMLEHKFRLLRLTEQMKAEYASHQLQGPAGIWWRHYRSTLSENAQITWNQFQEAFKSHYIPSELMAIKHNEFMKLVQGTKTLTEYLHAFNHLARYALEFVDSESKKISSFKRGLSPKLMKSMGNNKSVTFNEFISDALTQENNNNVYVASKNRKRVLEVGVSQAKAPVAKTQFRPPTTAIRYRPPQKKNQAKTGFKKAFTVPLPKGTTGPGNSFVSPANRPWWNCGRTGHWSKNCPYPQKNNQKQGNSGARQGYVNYTNVTKIPSGEVVTAAFASKYNQEVIALSTGSYCISASGSSISTNQIVQAVSIEIGGRVYMSNLVILPGLGIDVILGMKWMSGHGVLIDTSTRVVMLRDPINKEAFLVPLPRDLELHNTANAL